MIHYVGFFNPSCSDEEPLPGLSGIVLYNDCPPYDEYRMKLTSNTTTVFANVWTAVTCEVISMYSGGPIQITFDVHLTELTINENADSFANFNITSDIVQFVDLNQITIQIDQFNIVQNPITMVGISFAMAGKYVVKCEAPYRFSTED